MHNNREKQQGFMVGLAMLAIVILSFFLVTGATTMLSNQKVGGSYARAIDTFNYAEVGVAKARPLVEGQNFDTLLTNYHTGFFISPQPFGTGGTYEVRLSDNDDGDSNLTNDSDDIIKITSVGRSATGGTVTIITHLQQVVNIITPPNALPGGPAAGLLCGAASQAKTQGSSKISGCDYTLPAFPCSGAGCNGSLAGDNNSNGVCDNGDTGGYAIAAQAGLTTSGSGFNGGEPSATLQNQGVTTACNDWVALGNQIAALGAGAPGVTIITGATISGFNDDCSAPKVYIINSSFSTVTMSGSNMMCGIMMVASNTSVNLTGTSTFVGIVMVMGNNTTVDFNATTGTANVFGQVITNEIAMDAGDEIGTKGNASIKYSSQAVAYAEQALSKSGVGGGGALLTVAWEEQY